MSRVYPLVQEISVDGQHGVLPDHVIECSIIENGDMSGTKLIMYLSDRNAYYRDDLGIRKDTEIELTYGDPEGRGDNIFIDTFTVMTPTAQGDVLKIEGFQKHCHLLKQPAQKAQFFVDQDPEKIIRALIPGVKLDVDSAKPGTYHLNPGASPSRLIRNMARDYGAMAFYCRGTFYFKRLNALLSQQPAFTYEHQNPSAEVSINHYQICDKSYMYKRVLNRQYIRWDTVEGLQKDGDPQNGIVMVTAPTAEALDNQNQAVIPVLEVDMLGNSSFMPSLAVNVVLNLGDTEKVIDETLPEKQLISRVTHYQTGNRYLCRQELGVPNE